MNVGPVVQAISPPRLLAQADLVLLVCDLLRPPDPAQIAQLLVAREALDELLSMAGCADEQTADVFAGALNTAATTPRECWSDEFNRLFDGATFCPLNQTAYVRRDKGAVIGDVCGFYRAFGFDVQQGTGEKPDHLVTELEFLAALLAMLAGAGDEVRARVTRGALITFASTHLSDWIVVATGRLENVTSLPFYGAVARVIQVVWSALAREHGFAVAPAADVGCSPIEPEPEPESPYECGMAPGDSAPREVELHVRGRALGAAD